jgi:tetratricopeptide (TPR) repeat protein
MRRVSVPLVLAMLGLGFAGYQYWTEHRFVAGQVPMRPIPADEVKGHVLALAGVDAGALAQQLVPDAKLQAFASAATAGKSSAQERARALVDALQARAQRGAFADWTRVDPRPGPPLTAAATLNALQADGAKRQLYPFELASVAVAALRSLDVPALMAEVYRYPSERAPLDPSGRLGYYAVFIGEPQRGTGQLFDPYGGRSTQPAAGDFALLDDVQVAGVGLTLQALTHFDATRDAAAVQSDAQAAVKLLPKSPSAHCARALLLLAQPEGNEQGTSELNEALSLHADAPRHVNLATHALAQQDMRSASTHIKAALDEAPDYALAQVLLASTYLINGEYAQSRQQLDAAEKLTPDLALLPQLRAQLAAAVGELDMALESAQEGVKRRPNDPQPLFILARIERRAGRADDMRKHAQELLALVSPNDRDRRRQQLQRVFGDDVFNEAPSANAKAVAPAAH